MNITTISVAISFLATAVLATGCATNPAQTVPAAAPVISPVAASGACTTVLDCANLSVKLSEAARIAAHNAVPVGSVVMWFGKSGPIPDGWAICDGKNGTPNLLGHLPMGTGDFADQGKEIGSEKHHHNISIQAVTEDATNRATGQLYQFAGQGRPPEGPGLDVKYKVNVVGQTLDESSIPLSTKIIFIMKMR